MVILFYDSVTGKEYSYVNSEDLIPRRGDLVTFTPFMTSVQQRKNIINNKTNTENRKETVIKLSKYICYLTKEFETVDYEGYINTGLISFVRVEEDTLEKIKDRILSYSISESHIDTGVNNKEVVVAGPIYEVLDTITNYDYRETERWKEFLTNEEEIYNTEREKIEKETQEYHDKTYLKKLIEKYGVPKDDEVIKNPYIDVAGN